jgi:hypothetical protein
MSIKGICHSHESGNPDLPLGKQGTTQKTGFLLSQEILDFCFRRNDNIGIGFEF